MSNTETDKQDTEKLVKVDTPDSISRERPEYPPTKKRAYRIRRIAEPHIRKHEVKGKIYYTYCRGTDKEIYLGTAENILRAVKNKAIRQTVRKE